MMMDEECVLMRVELERAGEAGEGGVGGDDGGDGWVLTVPKRGKRRKSPLCLLVVE